MDLTSASRWIERLRSAWVEGDGKEAATLFTSDAIYRAHPFRAPLHGQDEIARYWSEATSSQADLTVRFGEPLVDGERVAVEWWANVTEGDRLQTDCGALILRFQAGDSGGWLCTELREYWNMADSAIAPPAGWGQ